VPLRSGRILFNFAAPKTDAHRPPPRDAIGYVSFEIHQTLMEHEERQEDLRAFASKNDEVTTVRDVIFSGILADRTVTPVDEARCAEIAPRLGIQPLLQQPITSLSTGEIPKHSLPGPDEIRSCSFWMNPSTAGRSLRQSLAESIDHLMTTSMRVILVVTGWRKSYQCHPCSYKDGRLFMQARKMILTSENIVLLMNTNFIWRKATEDPGDPWDRGSGPIDADLCARAIRTFPISNRDEGVTVQYDGRVVLDKLNWVMKQEELGHPWAQWFRKSTILR
jgi:hypothetical protein